MIFEHIGLNQINGSLVVLDGVKGASYEEMVELRLEDGTSRAGRIVKIDGELVVIQVFDCLLYTSPSPRDGLLSRMPSSA